MFNFDNNIFENNMNMMKEMYENWEKQTGENLKKLVNDKNFISEMAKTLAATMSGQAGLKKTMDESLIAMNLPTRGELVKALQKLTDIEDRIIDISEKLEDLEDKMDKLNVKAPAAKAAPKKAAPKKPAAPKKASK